MMRIGQTILRRYEVEDLMPEGGQAILAKGIDRKKRCPVAIKQLKAAPGDPHYKQELARFQRAAELRFSHRAVVDPIDSGRESKEWYMIMSYVESTDLERHLIKNGGALPAKRATAIIRTIADGLIPVHGQGIVHRDIKPSNILIDKHNRPYLIDFGICRDLSQSPGPQGSGLLGTPPWMSPEQIEYPGSEEFPSDLYSLGAAFYMLLTGQVPAAGDDAGSLLLNICRTTPPSPRQVNPRVPADIDRICMTLLAKRPEERFQTAEELCYALDNSKLVIQKKRACPACGEAVEADARFCRSCRTELTASITLEPRCLACGAVAGNSKACPSCQRQFSPADYRLIFKTGPLHRNIFRIPEGAYEVGRNELEPRDQYISKQHFRMVCKNGSVNIQDVGSTNKTYIGGRSADSPIRLVPLCQLQIADNMATFTSH